MTPTVFAADIHSGICDAAQALVELGGILLSQIVD